MVLYNTEEAANILGVNVSTIKRWSSAGKLKCLRTAGGHRKFEMKHLTEFIESNKKESSRVNAFPIEKSEDNQISEWVLKKDYKNLARYILNQAIKCNRNKVLDVFKGLFLSKVTLHEIYDMVVSPVLQQIGERWEIGQLSVTEEHFASQTIKDSVIRLQSLISLPEKKKGIVMAMNLFNDLHDIVLKMVDHILESKGFKVLYSGQLTPQLHLENILEDYAPKRLYISSTFIDDLEKAQNEFDAICSIAEKYTVKIYIGGRGFDFIDYDKEPVVERLFTFKDTWEK